MIRSFNANKPFDRFTIEQLAGDLVAGADRRDPHRLGLQPAAPDDPGGGSAGQGIHGQVLGGPGAQRLDGLAGRDDGLRRVPRPQVRPVHDPRVLQPGRLFRRREGDRRRRPGADAVPDARAGRSTRAARGNDRAALKAIKNPSPSQKQEAGRAGPAARRRCMQQIPSIAGLDGDRAAGRCACCRAATGWTTRGRSCMPGVPASLPPLGVKDRRATRLDLARWLVSRRQSAGRPGDGQRLWKLVFGQGLVTTLDDFGSQGAWPTHPELLDWLACEFVDSGWDVKAMLKQMVMSQTYRQSSGRVRVDAAARPGQPLARAPEPRSGSTPSWSATTPWPISGLLSDEIGGPSVKPYQPPGYWVFLNFPKRDYDARPRGRTSIAAACTPTGSGRSCTPACWPSTPRRARNAWSSGRGRTRRSRPWCC